MVGQGQLIQREAQVAYKALKVAKLGQEMLPFLFEGPPSLRVLLLAAQPAALGMYMVSLHILKERQHKPVVLLSTFSRCVHM